MEANGDPPRIIVPVFLLQNNGTEIKIGHIVQYEYPTFKSIRHFNKENKK